MSTELRSNVAETLETKIKPKLTEEAKYKDLVEGISDDMTVLSEFSQREPGENSEEFNLEKEALDQAVLETATEHADEGITPEIIKIWIHGKSIDASLSALDSLEAETYSDIFTDPAATKVVQHIMISLGLDIGKTGDNENGVDGDYGGLTKASVLKIQQTLIQAGYLPETTKNSHGEWVKNADGAFGPLTIKALKEAINNKLVSPEPEPEPEPESESESESESEPESEPESAPAPAPAPAPVLVEKTTGVESLGLDPSRVQQNIATLRKYFEPDKENGDLLAVSKLSPDDPAYEGQTVSVNSGGLVTTSAAIAMVKSWKRMMEHPSVTAFESDSSSPLTDPLLTQLGGDPAQVIVLLQNLVAASRQIMKEETQPESGVVISRPASVAVVESTETEEKTSEAEWRALSEEGRLPHPKEIAILEAIGVENVESFEAVEGGSISELSLSAENFEKSHYEAIGRLDFIDKLKCNRLKTIPVSEVDGLNSALANVIEIEMQGIEPSAMTKGLVEAFEATQLSPRFNPEANFAYNHIASPDGPSNHLTAMRIIHRLEAANIKGVNRGNPMGGSNEQFFTFSGSELGQREVLEAGSTDSDYVKMISDWKEAETNSDEVAQTQVASLNLAGDIQVKYKETANHFIIDSGAERDVVSRSAVIDKTDGTVVRPLAQIIEEDTIPQFGRQRAAREAVRVELDKITDQLILSSIVARANGSSTESLFKPFREALSTAQELGTNLHPLGQKYEDIHDSTYSIESQYYHVTNTIESFQDPNADQRQKDDAIASLKSYSESPNIYDPKTHEAVLSALGVSTS